MGSIETAPLVGDQASSKASEKVRRPWKLSSLAADFATLGMGTAMAGVFNAALVFVLPRLMSVEDYGYWRSFALYAAYAGFLHLGFADGALVRWAGRSWEDFHGEIRPALRYQFWQQVAVLGPLCLAAAVFLRGPFRFVAIAVAVYAVVINQTTLLQFGLQDAKIFAPVAISIAAAPAFFFALVLAWSAKWRMDYREVAEFFIVAWLAALVYLLVRTKPWTGARAQILRGSIAKEWLGIGWPIVVANTAVLLIQFADRFAVNWAATIENFAQYSLAASAMGVPIMAIQACSQVSFSHFAGLTLERRRKIYGLCSYIVLAAWAALLPYYFVLAAFVRHFLPKYEPSLPYARVMLLGIPFLAAVQILQTNYAYLGGVQGRFSVVTLGALAVSLGITSFVAFSFGSLRLVAAVQVALLAAWWLFNEWSLRGLTGERVGSWLRFAVAYSLVGVCYWWATRPAAALAAALACYVAAGLVLCACFSRSFRFFWHSVGNSA
jgi:O-antigen/teichoic acid export membrane protein